MLRRRPTNAILTDLLSPLEATEAVVMVQIILRDLDPVLYPPASYSSETSLLQYNAAAYHRISVVDAMSLWHPQMPSLYRTVADLDYISDLTEKALRKLVSQETLYHVADRSTQTLASSSVQFRQSSASQSRCVPSHAVGAREF